MLSTSKYAQYLRVEKISSLQDKVIVWPDFLTEDETEILAISTDGVDFRVWEPKHPHYNIDTGHCSTKFKHGAFKYLIAILVREARVIFFDGPFRGGEHDINMFRNKLKDLMKTAAPGKKLNADAGFKSSMNDEKDLFCLPDGVDSKGLAKFKSRVRCRQETLNGRLKFYRALSDTFKHGKAKHYLALSAILVTVQYQMNNGSPIFTA